MKTKLLYRSKLLILSYICQFSLSRTFGDGKTYGGLLNSAFQEDRNPPVGSLVALTSAPASKWYISWVVDRERYSGGDYEYLLESIEDGSLCRWSNVSLWRMNQETVDLNDWWRWTDQQHRFNDMWMRCYRKLNEYILRPNRVMFGMNNTVKLSIRTAFNLGPSYWKDFDNWKKVRQRDMVDFYKSCQKLHQNDNQKY